MANIEQINELVGNKEFETAITAIAEALEAS